MHELARLGFVLLGINLAVSPLSSIAERLADFVELGANPIIIATILAVLSVSLVPGVLLIFHSKRLATKLFGIPGAEPIALDMESVVAAGLALLGICFALDGAVVLASTFGTFALTSHLLEQAWIAGTVRGGLLLLLGVALTAGARSLARRLSTPS